MSLQIILKNSSVSGKEPTASQLANGELALNYHADGPFISCKDSAGTVRRIAGVWISTTAPTSPTPGEFWLDTNTDPAKLKVYKDGTDTWVETITIVAASTTAAGVVELATDAETQTGTDTLRAVTPASLQSKVSDSTTTTSSTTIASSTAVKSAKDVADAALPAAGGTISGNLTVSGDLTVNGTTTTIDTTTLIVEDKNIEMGAVGTPTDVTADGGGITLKGATDKTLNWVDSTDSWTSSENVDLASGKTYKIAGTDVLSSTTLGSGVIGSSLTSVGTITSGTWNGTQIATAYIADSAVTSAKIEDGTIVNADVNASAAIAGTKIDADFGAQDLTVDTNVLHVDATNNRVGVGTTSPDNKLDIREDGTFNQDSSGQLVLRGTTDPNKTLRIGFDTTSDYGYLQSIQVGTAAKPLVLQPWAGNVGVGTSSPILTFSVDGDSWFGNGNGVEIGRLFNDSGVLCLRASSNVTGLGLATNSSSTHAIRIDSSGQVGIGTTTPNAALTVHGSAGNAKIRLGQGGDHTIIGPNASGHTVIDAGTVGGEMQFQLAGSTKATLNSTGLGINTSAARAPLHAHTTSGESHLHLTNADTGATADDGFSLVAMTSVDNNEAWILQRENAAMRFYTNSFERAVISADGKMGIGSTTLVERLHVNGGVRLDVDNQGLYFNSSTTAIVGNGTSSEIYFYTSNAEKAQIDSSGNFGLGTTNPSSNIGSTPVLDVSGTYGGLALSSSVPSANKVEIGNYGYNTMVFATNSTEHARIDADGRLGLGTTSPSSYNSVADNLVVSSAGDTGITINAGTASSANIFFADSGNDSQGQIRYFHSIDALSFGVNGGDAMRINSSKFVGIGTTSPDSLLHIANTGGIAKMTIESANESQAFINMSAQSSESSVGYVRDSAGDGSIRFCFANDLTSAEALRLNSYGYLYFSGNVSTNVTAVRAGLAGQLILVANSGGLYHQAGSSYYTVTTSGGSTSDVTLKTDIQPITDSLEKLSQIRGVTFSFIDEPLSHSDRGQQIGVIAQEVEPVFPEAVVTGEDGIKAVRYDKLVAPLIEALKEAKERIETLEAKVAALEGN